MAVVDQNRRRGNQWKIVGQNQSWMGNRWEIVVDRNQSWRGNRWEIVVDQNRRMGNQ